MALEEEEGLGSAVLSEHTGGWRWVRASEKSSLHRAIASYTRVGMDAKIVGGGGVGWQVFRRGLSSTRD